MSERGIDYINGETRRAIDKMVSASALVLGALPMAAAAVLAAREHGRRNIFFRQERSWEPDPSFSVTKFRTVPPEFDSGVYALSDPRASRAANFMRRTGIDELPQLLHVWRGDMTFLSIRPVMDVDLERRSESDPALFDEWYAAYSSVKPGLTSAGGLWYHEADPDAANPDLVNTQLMIRDLHYVEHASVQNDMQFLAEIPQAVGKAASNFLRS